MEIEAKFRISDSSTFPYLLKLQQLGAFQLQAVPDVEQQRNSYFDTADGRFKTARYGLRLRQIGSRSLVTLKGPNQVENGLHQREEWEFHATSPDPATWPDGPARKKAQALLGEAPLQQLLTIHTERQHVIAYRNGQPVVELSLDDGTIFAGSLTEHFRELELELLPAGTRADLDDLIAALKEQIALLPENLSKLERGLALLARAS
ncbi:MAG: CYTH domain-containing protein [Chloroflexaceae bacterium]|jgi:inorganic triphosphatase YgiF|nr:CYTH domain-containing protein [Chloroflexaceae bacterium]